MKWKKLGLIWSATDGTNENYSHGMAPTPIQIEKGKIRIFFTRIDQNGKGLPFFIDVDDQNPSKILTEPTGPLMTLGLPGSFDDAGALCTSVIQDTDNTKLVMYYAGFELLKSIRYRIFTGIAVSNDNGETFERISSTPALDRRDGEALFRGGPFVMKDDDNYRIWYVSGNTWIDINNKEMPVYNLKTMTSSSLFEWDYSPKTALKLDSKKDEHGFGRPWITKGKDGTYHLFYSIRVQSKGQYALGYAQSKDGISWNRMDNEVGLNSNDFSFESEAICYSAVISVENHTYCFYNGNNFGIDGIAAAELIN